MREVHLGNAPSAAATAPAATAPAAANTAKANAGNGSGGSAAAGNAVGMPMPASLLRLRWLRRLSLQRLGLLSAAALADAACAPDLFALDLSANRGVLQELPTTLLGRFTALRELRLSRLLLRDDGVPSLAPCPLQRLDLSHNLLTRLPRDLGSLAPTLLDLRLGHNFLDDAAFGALFVATEPFQGTGTDPAER